MLPQTIALCAAIAYALSFILSKRGMGHSTPITITFVSLLVQTVVLFAIVFAFTGIPSTPTFVFVLFAIAGVLQAVVRQLTYIGIEKIGAARSGPIRASVPLWSAALAIFFLGEKMTPAIGIGTLLVFAGILLISWRADVGGARQQTVSPRLGKNYSAHRRRRSSRRRRDDGYLTSETLTPVLV